MLDNIFDFDWFRLSRWTERYWWLGMLNPIPISGCRLDALDVGIYLWLCLLSFGWSQLPSEEMASDLFYLIVYFIRCWFESSINEGDHSKFPSNVENRSHNRCVKRVNSDYCIHYRTIRFFFSIPSLRMSNARLFHELLRSIFLFSFSLVHRRFDRFCSSLCSTLPSTF